MKILVLNQDYLQFVHGLYAQHPGLEQESYAAQLQVRTDSLFGVADFYSSNLQKLGHEACDIHANIEPLQRAWAREHGLNVRQAAWAFYMRNRVIPWVSRLNYKHWRYEILAAQINDYKPDVILNQVMNGISTRFLREIKPRTRLLVGQHTATKLAKTEDWGVYDLIVSSFPPMLDWARSRGIAAELNRLGFEPRVNSLLKPSTARIPISFVGSFHRVHQSRIEWLEQLAARFEIKVWAPDLNHLTAASPIRRHYMGPLWGQDMYQVLQDSQITLNHHGDIPPFANNCRLYEATGVGAFLITDWKANLHEMFEPGKEVAAYRSTAECAELLRHHLDHAPDRETIARAGRQRTLNTHTYYQRMQQLAAILQARL